MSLPCPPVLSAVCSLRGRLALIGALALMVAGCDESLVNSTPPPPPAPPSWVQVSAGTDHALGVKSDGTLWAWGNNASDQVGDGTTQPRYRPVQIGIATNWKQVAAGSAFSLALNKAGSLYGWGDRTGGKIGDGGATSGLQPIPIQVDPTHTYKAVAAGRSFGLAIQTDGTLWAWGDNSLGQLGNNGAPANQAAPVQVDSPNTYIAVAAGDTHALAIRTNGTLFAWGDNTAGKLGEGTTTQSNVPVPVDAANTYTAIAAGGTHSLGVHADGSLWAWGDNSLGQLGTGGAQSSSSIPVQVGTLTTWKAVAAGTDYSLAIQTDATLWSFGSNGSGQLGDASTATRSSPVAVAVKPGGWSQVTAHPSQTAYALGVQADGSLWGWGANGGGQLGDGTLTSKTSPSLQP